MLPGPQWLAASLSVGCPLQSWGPWSCASKTIFHISAMLKYQASTFHLLISSDFSSLSTICTWHSMTPWKRNVSKGYRYGGHLFHPFHRDVPIDVTTWCGVDTCDPVISFVFAMWQDIWQLHTIESPNHTGLFGRTFASQILGTSFPRNVRAQSIRNPAPLPKKELLKNQQSRREPCKTVTCRHQNLNGIGMHRHSCVFIVIQVTLSLSSMQPHGVFLALFLALHASAQSRFWMILGYRIRNSSDTHNNHRFAGIVRAKWM